MTRRSKTRRRPGKPRSATFRTRTEAAQRTTAAAQAAEKRTAAAQQQKDELAAQRKSSIEDPKRRVQGSIAAEEQKASAAARSKLKDAQTMRSQAESKRTQALVAANRKAPGQVCRGMALQLFWRDNQYCSGAFDASRSPQH